LVTSFSFSMIIPDSAATVLNSGDGFYVILR
jgi:hypothetical protein